MSERTPLGARSGRPLAPKDAAQRLAVLSGNGDYTVDPFEKDSAYLNSFDQHPVVDSHDPYVETKETKETKEPDDDGLTSFTSFTSYPAGSAGWPELDSTALHGLPGDIVRSLAPHTEADQAALLVSFLVGFGSAVGAGPHAVADGADHPGRLHAVIVGSTAKARKGTSWRRIRRVLAHADPDWAATRILGGLSSGEGLIAAVADAATDNDGNPTGGVTDKRLLVVEEEYARVLTVARRESNILTAVLRQAWDRGDLRTMTKTPLAATGAHVSVLGHITVAELRSKLTETDQANGFGNRSLWVCARRSQLLPHGGADTDDLHRDLGNRVAAALDTARRVGIVSRTDAADRLWEYLYAEMAEDDPGGLAGALIARAEAHVLRLSLVYALADRASRVDVEHLDAAWAMWRYCRDSAAYIFGDTLGDDVADRLLAAVRATTDGLDRTAQSAVFGRNVPGERLEHARRLLAACGLCQERTVDTGGRPRTVLFALGDQSDRSDQRSTP